MNSWPFAWSTEGAFRNDWDCFASAEKKKNVWWVSLYSNCLFIIAISSLHFFSSISSGHYYRMSVLQFLQVMTSQEMPLRFPCVSSSQHRLRALFCRIALMGSAIQRMEEFLALDATVYYCHSSHIQHEIGVRLPLTTGKIALTSSVIVLKLNGNLLPFKETKQEGHFQGGSLVLNSVTTGSGEGEI